MEYKILDASGPIIMYPHIWGDARGYFMETFRQNDFNRICGNFEFVQDNQSKSSRNVLRGLHYQLPKPQGKLVRVISGEVFDVAVDIRKSSPNFGKIYSVVLNTEEHNIFWVPPGFAHGFFVLSSEAEFVYKCTDYYYPETEHCIFWNDPELPIHWPFSGSSPLISEKDKEGKLFKDAAYFD